MGVKLRYRKNKNNLKSYYLDIHLESRRYYENLGIREVSGDNGSQRKTKKILAETIAAKKAEELMLEDKDYVPQHKKKIDFIKFFSNFVNDYKGRDKRIVRYAYEKFEAYLKDEYRVTKLSVSKLDSKICEGYANYLKDNNRSGLSGETPYNYWAKFKRVIRALYNDGIIRDEFSKGIVVTRDQTKLKKNVLTKDELNMAAKSYCGNETVKRAFLFGCFTGLGIVEIRDLKWGNIKNEKIHIDRKKNENQIINDLPKSALKILKLQEEEDDESIFPNLPSDTAIWKLINNWMIKAGITKHISFYCCRHTFATQLLLNGANLKTVADCLGHSSTRHTLKYLNYVDSLKSDALSKLPIINL